MALGRWGANLEVAVAPHHALVLSGYLQTFQPWLLRRLLPSAVDTNDAPPSRAGGEIGYRFYTGANGPQGVFLGPSLVAMPIAYPYVGADLRAEVTSFEAYGAALDVGAQAIVDGGLTLGVGIGAMYLAYSPPPSVAPPAGVAIPGFAEPHVLPRLLLAAGWSF
jgi:hypothetical protein